MADPWENDPIIQPRQGRQAQGNPWDSDPVVSPGQAQPRQQSAVARQPAPQITFANDRDALIRTVLGEARGEPPEGQAAVAAVVLNRARGRNMTPSQVVLERNQFEPWGNPDTARRLMSIRQDDPAYLRAAAQVDRALQGFDPTNGADHFYAPVAQQQMGRPRPSWDNGSGVPLGGHLFFNLGGSTEDARLAAADGSAIPAQMAEEPAFTADQTAAQVAAPGSSQETAIDLNAIRYDDEVRALRQGAWVRNGDEVYQLPGDAFTDRARASDEAVQGNIFVRRPNLGDQVGNFAQAFTEQIPFGDEAVAAGVGLVSGQGYDAIRQRQAASRELGNQTDRGARVAGGLSGFGAGLAAPGGALINRGGNLASRSLRSAGVGMGYGAAYGAGAADDGYAGRLQGLVAGGVTGGITGGATPAIGQVASSATNFVTRPIGRGLNYLNDRFLNNAIPGLDRFAPDAQAQTRISEALRNDGVTMEQLRSAAQEFTDTGVTPTLIDVIQRAAPGGEAARLVRGAAMQQGPASVAAERYLDRVGGNIQDRAIGLTRELTPGNTQTADEAVEAFTTRRRNDAATQYAAPYAERVTPSQDVMSALSGEPGLAALRRARTAAVARQDTAQADEIDALMATLRVANDNPALAGRIPPPEVSGATLDRVQRAMGGRARRMEMSPDTRDIASGLYARQGSVNDFLDNVPGLGAARESYRNTTRQIEAVEQGATGLNAAPDSFRFDELTRPAAQVGYRSSLERAIGAGGETSTGTLNRIATSTNQTRNLQAVFGQGAEGYQAGLRNLIDQLSNARFLASSSGSQTAPRLADQALAGIASLPANAKAGFIGLLEKAARGATLTRRERNAIVELGVSEAELREIAQLPFVSGYLTAPVSQQAGRLVAQ